MDRPEALSEMPPEEIRGHIAATREALGDKLETLTDIVEQAKASVRVKGENIRGLFSPGHYLIGHQGPLRFRRATVAPDPAGG